MALLLNQGNSLLYSVYIAVDRCPMYFNDGSDPWVVEENHIRVFDFSDYSGANVILSAQLQAALIFTFALRALL